MDRSDDVLVSRLAMEVAVALAFLAVGATVTFGSMEFGTGWGDAGPQPGYFPFYIGLVIMAASVGTLVQAVLQHRDRRVSFLTRVQARRVAAFGLPMLGFVLLASGLGLYVALIVYLTATMIVQGRYPAWKALLVGLLTAVAFHVVFEVWFKVPLLKGPIEAWLRIH